MRDQEILDLSEAYASIYTNLIESHFKVGDKVICKDSGMTGEVIKLDKKHGGDDEKYYTVKREDGETVKYSPNELKLKGKKEVKESIEYFTEEVQIAAEYFLNLGLNEEGVDFVVEELGPEEFAQWVYDLSEEYLLDEARRSGSIEPKTAKGQEIKGKPSGASLKRLRKLKAERTEREEKASEEKPSGLTASLKRQSAVANAKKQQPKKKGVLDRVAGAVLKGIERHNAAMSAARETGKTIGKAAKGAGEVAKGFASGVSGTARLAGRLASKGLDEGVDVFDVILEHLVAEGYAETNEGALVIMANMSEEWKQSIVEAYGSFGANMAGAELQRRQTEKVRQQEREKIEQEKKGGSGASSQVKGA